MKKVILVLAALVFFSIYVSAEADVTFGYYDVATDSCITNADAVYETTDYICIMGDYSSPVDIYLVDNNVRRKTGWNCAASGGDSVTTMHIYASAHGTLDSNHFIKLWNHPREGEYDALVDLNGNKKCDSLNEVVGKKPTILATVVLPEFGTFELLALGLVSITGCAMIGKR